jgi:drug/metabolite transporter (DMT)-like permease
MSFSLSVASSLLWGVSDFCGGKAARTCPVLTVVSLSQTTGLVAATVAALVVGGFSAPLGYLPWAVGSGLAGGSAVLLFYEALAIGKMGIVAPLAALGVVVPVVIGLFSGALPSKLALTGIVVAVTGVTFAAKPGRAGEQPRGHPRSVILALGSAVGFGLLQYALSGGSKYSTVMTMVGMRATSVPLLVLAASISTRGSPRGPSVAGRMTPGLLTVILIVGVFDVSANLLFALATVSGDLAIVAVLGSLYPAVTVLLARVVDHERLSRVQQLGVVAAVAGVAMIAAGS